MTRNNSIYNNLIELVGQTPMVQLNVITNTFPGKYFAKLEMFNPGQSQKDRIALHIIENAEQKGILKKGSTIVETTSGNTGFLISHDSHGKRI
jgi:cystathionine beta-synthase